jgi:hypothetical protein
MQKRLLLRVSAGIAGSIFAVGFLFNISSARSEAQSAYSSPQNNSGPARCTNRTIAGNYAFTVEGNLLLGPGVNLPVRGISLAHYDGKGGMTQVDHVVDNGMPPAQEWTPGSGTYTVNPDCTGSQVIDIPGNPASPLNIHFVVDQNGKEIRQVVDANAITATGSRLD